MNIWRVPLLRALLRSLAPPPVTSAPAIMTQEVDTDVLNWIDLRWQYPQNISSFKTQIKFHARCRYSSMSFYQFHLLLRLFLLSNWHFTWYCCDVFYANTITIRTYNLSVIIPLWFISNRVLIVLIYQASISIHVYQQQYLPRHSWAGIAPACRVFLPRPSSCRFASWCKPCRLCETTALCKFNTKCWI